MGRARRKPEPTKSAPLRLVCCCLASSKATSGASSHCGAPSAASTSPAASPTSSGSSREAHRHSIGICAAAISASIRWGALRFKAACAQLCAAVASSPAKLVQSVQSKVAARRDNHHHHHHDHHHHHHQHQHHHHHQQQQASCSWVPLRREMVWQPADCSMKAQSTSQQQQQQQGSQSRPDLVEPVPERMQPIWPPRWTVEEQPAVRKQQEQEQEQEEEQQQEALSPPRRASAAAIPGVESYPAASSASAPSPCGGAAVSSGFPVLRPGLVRSLRRVPSQAREEEGDKRQGGDWRSESGSSGRSRRWLGSSHAADPEHSEGRGRVKGEGGSGGPASCLHCALSVRTLRA
ncbi:hypothetical protein PLESTB_000398700 [Pleodorina starrii]|uniref:Uncharacterized protein n=1 Tax=Pleodorina starrii TaxID=330485 RepID=A0A9W6EZB9_9CHLO|nr:hypothetical protein PLESTB_000398700 [Pleodorina starrii]GLC77339.1 hypothetical protein PLESTF_001921800 [Pleodorina starrii]